jgi:hypothetical protein
VNCSESAINMLVAVYLPFENADYFLLPATQYQSGTSYSRTMA